MRISVIIPCHNAARWIGQAVRSAATQTLAPHEIIVIDDASTDDSVTAVKNASESVRLIHVRERNAAASRNHGIDAATGDWIAFLDADDYWYPTHLRMAADLLTSSNDVAHIGQFDVERLDGTVEKLPTPHPIHESRSGLSHRDFLPFMTGNCLFGHSTVLISAARIREVGRFDVGQKRRHDMDLWLRVIHSKTWSYGASPCSVYRLETPGSISRSVSECEYYFLKTLLKNHVAFAGPEFDELIATSARRSMSLTFVDGPSELYDQVKSQAWPYLSWRLKFAYQAAAIAPFVLQAGIRCKRRLRNAVLDARSRCL